MPLHLRLQGTDLLPGMRVELYPGPPYDPKVLAGKQDLPAIRATTLPASRLLDFPTAGPGFALRVLDGTVVMARSNGFASVTTDSTGFSSLSVIQITQVISAADIAGLDLGLPIDEEKIHVDAVQLDYVGDTLRVRGRAAHRGLVSIDFDFDVRARIRPSTRPVWRDPRTLAPKDLTDEICVVEIADIEVHGVRRVEGAIVNIFRRVIRKRFAAGLQQRITQRILDATLQLGVTPQVSMVSTTITPAEMTMVLSVFFGPEGLASP